MQNLNYLIFTVSLAFLYWFTFTAYDRVIRVNTIDTLPLLPKQSCIITHLEIKNDNNKVNDLNIYYSGIQKPETENAKVIQNEAKVQEEILNIVKNKKEIAETEKKPIESKKSEEHIKNIEKSKDDTFSAQAKKKPEKKKLNNVFDVLE